MTFSVEGGCQRFNKGDSVQVIGPNIQLGKVVDWKRDRNGCVWYLVHDSQSRSSERMMLERLDWYCEDDVYPPSIRRHDPKLDHYWDHTPS